MKPIYKKTIGISVQLLICIAAIVVFCRMCENVIQEQGKMFENQLKKARNK